VARGVWMASTDVTSLKRFKLLGGTEFVRLGNVNTTVKVVWGGDRTMIELVL
jgi:hypothetical protein